jgi:hypothetical protein
MPKPLCHFAVCLQLAIRTSLQLALLSQAISESLKHQRDILWLGIVAHDADPPHLPCCGAQSTRNLHRVRVHCVLHNCCPVNALWDLQCILQSDLNPKKWPDRSSSSFPDSHSCTLLARSRATAQNSRHAQHIKFSTTLLTTRCSIGPRKERHTL